MNKLHAIAASVLTIAACIALPLTSRANPASPVKQIRLEAPDVDALVKMTVAEINSRDDTKEFGFFLLCDTTCWTTDILYGNSNSISIGEIARVYPEKDTDLIVGFIHSHPKSDYDSLLMNHLFDELNTGPSVSDYQFALAIAADGIAFQPFTLWIIAPDNQLYTHELPRPTPN